MTLNFELVTTILVIYNLKTKLYNSFKDHVIIDVNNFVIRIKPAEKNPRFIRYGYEICYIIMSK